LTSFVTQDNGEPLSSVGISVEVLQKRIAVLERKSAREKKARNLAENELERYSLEIYQTNQSLQTALAFSTKKQSELEYLGKASMTIGSQLPLNDVVDNMVALTCEYCAAQYGFYFVTVDGLGVDGKLDQAWSKELGWHRQNELQKLVKANLPLNEADVLGSWFVSVVKDDGDQHMHKFDSLLYMNFALSGGKVGWLAFLSTIEHLGEELLPILTTARSHLITGIQRRLSDVRILKRNVQLQDSIDNLEAAKQQLIQSEKMASLGQLAAGIAHEINNPIAFIRSNMEILNEYLNDYKRLFIELNQSVLKNKLLGLETFEKISQKIDLDYLDEDSKDLIVSNINGLDRVKDIVDNLKSFSHAGDQAQVKMSIPVCIVRALKIAETTLKYEHKVDNHLSDNCPWIMGNLGQLQQVFVNLFVNATDAMDAGGQMTISHTKTDQRVIIHVKDTGCGMSKDTVKKLFTPFFTTKPVGRGTGLGLSVSYTILEAHNVQISIDSEIGIGTTFNLSFPLLS
jgi:two-component system NtrC family sensor kinase